MKQNYNYDPQFHFPVEQMDNEEYIKLRLEKHKQLNTKQKQTLERILRFLYITEARHTVYRSTIKKYEAYLDHPAEKIMVYRFETRSTGSEKENYGISAVIAIRKAKYKCEELKCNERDVRCLEFDHVHGRKTKKGGKKKRYLISDYRCLCANHHRIKTVMEKQQN